MFAHKSPAITQSKAQLTSLQHFRIVQNLQVTYNKIVILLSSRVVQDTTAVRVAI